MFRRPTMHVYRGTLPQDGDAHDPNARIGYLRDPFQCCAVTTDAYVGDPAAGADKSFRVFGSFMQLGICCRHCPLSPCQTAHFAVKSDNGDEIGSVQKVSAGCCAKMCGNVDNFEFSFPEAGDVPFSVDHKAMFIA